MPDDMNKIMKKENHRIKLKFDRVPHAATAAMLSSALSAFILTSVYGSAMNNTAMYSVMLLCAVFTAIIELITLPNTVLLCGTALFLCIGGALFFFPSGENSIYSTVMTGGETAPAAVLPIALLMCGAICLTLCVLNRNFTARCIIAGGLFVMLIMLIWFRFILFTAPAILITAYILIVLCQVCTSGISSASDSPKDMWYVMFSLAVSAIIFSLPTPDTRIQWEKLFEIRSSEQLVQLSEVLDIDQIDDDSDILSSGYLEDQSDLGGWLNLISGTCLQVEFSETPHSDRLTGSIYDSYIGTGWLCTANINGTGYSSPTDASSADFVSASDLYGSVRISDISENSDKGKKQETLFYPPYSYAVISDSAGEIAVRDGMHLSFEQLSDDSYTAYYYKQPSEYRLTASESDQYLSLPENLPQRIKDMAITATAECINDESKAYELMRILCSYKYETHVRSLPKGRDFVDYFLFDSKKGYCAYFASAMAVLARCADIPSRYVLGYYIGPDNTLVTTASKDEAHAWAELYIDGRWIVYDPAFSPPEDIAGNIDEDKTPQDTSALKRILMYSYVITAAAVVIFIIFKPFFRRLPWRLSIKRKYGKSSGYPIILKCGKLLWVLSACGVKRSESETLTEFGARIRKECTWLDDITGEKLSHFLKLTNRVLYSPDVSSDHTKENLARRVKKAYIRKFGLLKYLRGYRRAQV